MVERDNDEDTALAIFWLLSRNETKSNYKASTEEFLLEFLEEMNRSYQKDLRRLREESTSEKKKEGAGKEDSKTRYKEFMRAIAKRSEAYKHEKTDLRKLSCMPSFVLSLVMVSRVRGHYTHAPWFKVSIFDQMVEVHGAVSDRSLSYDMRCGTNYLRQLISEFMIESMEMLQRIANPNKPPLTLKEIQDARAAIADTSNIDEEEAIKGGLLEMDDAFRLGQGSLTDWSPELLDAIDACFVENFIKEGEPNASLFYPNSADGLDLFTKYFEEVDIILQTSSKVPPYARHYFAYFCIWQMQPYVYFPLPLGTASVIGIVNKMMHRVRHGMAEVSKRFLPSRGGFAFRRMRRA
jgi:hypothetical protein